MRPERMRDSASEAVISCIVVSVIGAGVAAQPASSASPGDAPPATMRPVDCSRLRRDVRFGMVCLLDEAGRAGGGSGGSLGHERQDVVARDQLVVLVGDLDVPGDDALALALRVFPVAVDLA